MQKMNIGAEKNLYLTRVNKKIVSTFVLAKYLFNKYLINISNEHHAEISEKNNLKKFKQILNKIKKYTHVTRIRC
jgi:hypothetical protein